MTKDAAYGKRALNRIADDLDHPAELEQQYVGLLLEKARQNAERRPTAQSAMAASALTSSGNVIRTAGTLTEGVALSSEYGSDFYPQFHHVHTPEGLWLHPAAEDVGVLQNMDQQLEAMLQENI